VQHAMKLFSDTMRMARIAPSDESVRVLLIGGSSKLRCLQEAFQARFPGRVYVPEHGDWSVSQGASRLAASPGCYRIMQKVFLELCDGSLLELAGHGDRFDGGHKAYLLGMTRRSDSAQLVFAESLDHSGAPSAKSRDLRRIAVLSVPMHEFLHEDLDMRCQLTKNLTVRVLCKGAHGASVDVRCWEYGNVRFVYDLEG